MQQQWLQTSYGKAKVVRVQSSSHSEGGVGNICMATHGKDDTHKSRRVVLVFHISHMRISLWISRPCLFKEKRAPACKTHFLLSGAGLCWLNSCWISCGDTICPDS